MGQLLSGSPSQQTRKRGRREGQAEVAASPVLEAHPRTELLIQTTRDEDHMQIRAMQIGCHSMDVMEMISIGNRGNLTRSAVPHFATFTENYAS